MLQNIQKTAAPRDTLRYAGVHLLDNPFSIDGVFYYYVPHPMRDSVGRGAFATVPFGKGNRKLLAVVVEICDRAAVAEQVDPDRIKPLAGVCREQLFLSEKQLSLCFYLKSTTLCTLGEAIRTVVPAPALASLVDYYRATPLTPEQSGMGATGATPPAELLVLEHVRARGPLSEQTLKGRYGARVLPLLNTLCERGLLERELAVHQPAPPTESLYAPARPAADIEAVLRGEKGYPRVTSEAQRRVLSLLLKTMDHLPASTLRQEAEATSSHLKSLVSKGLLTVEERELHRTPAMSGPGIRTPHRLSEEQSDAVRTLETLAAAGEPRAALLHGVTGSGKTCVILETIDRMLDRGKGSIVLLPEIALTPQMLRIFRDRYGDRVAVIHSGLSAGERLDSYLRILRGEAPIAVGTRSAVFAPMPNLGLIVMDEEQEHTYKSDQNPKYHARDVARYRCATEGALLLLSSATPSFESYQKAVEGKYTLITMKNRYGAAVLPEVHIVDMRSEPGQGAIAPLGEALTGELRRVTAEGNQSVLFLNRRGYSHHVVCRSCGKAVTCARCSVAMNLHVKEGGGSQLVCHWCGARRPLPPTCPDCGAASLIRMGYGTQRVEEELHTLLPDARVLRMDADTTTTKTAYDDLLGRFRRHEADLLLGTQMVTKGHDFPDVTLVGVLMADMSLYLDDYRASERTFSLLTQVIGRAGRGDKVGLAVIQTMNPDSDVLKLACAQDYETFFHREIRLRRLLQFPPFCDMVLLTLTGPDEGKLGKDCVVLSELIKTLGEGEFSDVPLVAFGPFEAPVYRVDNVYRMRMVIKCRLNRRSRALFEGVLRGYAAKGSGGGRATLSIDFNPANI